TRLYLTTLFFGLLLLLDTLATQFVVSHSQNKLKREQEIAFANQKELIEQSMLTIATLKHDMKNQILTLMALQKEGKTEEIAHYTQHILDEIEGDDTCAQTNHFVVDSIINYKLRDHSNTDLNIILNLTLPPELPLLAYDLTIILGNLLDNALTALDQVQGERTLSITITSRFDNLMILMDNTFNGTLKIEDGNLRTTKGFSTGHGLGVPSVKQTVEKYHGEFHYEYGSQNFSVTVLIPINE
ncbi:MAG: GHKL domain-containing protein, partial [Eubacteriales bacterium]